MKQTARQLVLKSRLYRLIGLLFAVVGLVIFLIIFSHAFKGNFLHAAKDPFILLIVLLPFLPACVLAWMSSSLEKKALSKLEKSDESS